MSRYESASPCSKAIRWPRSPTAWGSSSRIFSRFFKRTTDLTAKAFRLLRREI